MSDKERRKKDGEDTNKKNQRMREDVNRRQTQAEKTAANDPRQRDPNVTNRSGTKS